MRITQRLSLSSAALVFAALASACGDISAPAAAVVADPQPQLSITEGGGYTGRFVLSPSQSTTFSDGVNTLYFPSGAVCDPRTSGYGPDLWDAPCAPLTSDLTITVAATVVKGRVNLDFTPNVRFNPSHPVWLVVKNDAIRNAPVPGAWTVFYNSGDGKLVDEGVTDRSLLTFIDRTNGLAIRRIKHFSGYNVYLGTVDDCEPYVDAGCVPIGDAQVQP